MHCDASFASWTLKIFAPLSNAKMLRAVVPLRDSSGVILRVLYIMDFLDNNIYLKSLFSQIQNERPSRIQNRKSGEVYNFPIYGGDDLSVFVRMSSKINVANSSEYSLIKSLYGSNSLLEFNDFIQQVKIRETIWRININLI